MNIRYMNPDFTIGIVGYGDFGELIYTLTKRYIPSAHIKVFSRSNKEDQNMFFSLKEVCDSDILFLSVPVSAFESVLKNIVPYIKKETVIVDVSAVKTYPIKILEEYPKQINYITTHPLFGPYSYEKKKHSVSGFRIVMCEHNLAQNTYTSISSFLEKLGIVIIKISPDEHDRLIAETLFLTHIIGQTVHQGEFDRTSIDTVSFGFIMDAVESVRGDVVLFKEVFKYNPYCRGVLNRFKVSLVEVEKLLE